MATCHTLPSLAPLRRTADEVHTWCVPLDVPAATSARLYATLSPDERDRSARFAFQRDRRRFIVARGVLRELLARQLDARPDQIRFVYNAFGKPSLGGEFAGRLEFNLSHSAGLALVAITAGSRVGVDLEEIRADADHAEIARQFFSAAEADHLLRLPDYLQLEAFYDCWTRKEAVLKARGGALAAEANGLSDDAVAARGWSVFTLRPAAGYAGALAIAGKGWRVREWRWEAGRESPRR